VEALILLTGLVIVIFLLLHLRPLNEGEVKALAIKRRHNVIFKYYNFDMDEYAANKNFKKRMNPNGKFYEIDHDLHSFPSIAAALLKYKKHEWIIISFEKC